MSSLILVAGDPIKDIYIEVLNKKTIARDSIPGGAMNAYLNAQSILANTDFQTIWAVPKPEKEYELLRINSQTYSLYPDNQKINFYSGLSKQTYINAVASAYNFSQKKIILLSDYNKGVLTSPVPKQTSPLYDFLIVDSKYRSLDLSWLPIASRTIWRCTGSEYCPKYSQNFDYTIWTDGPNPIKVFAGQQILFELSLPPSSNVVDTCGAGDTFTAAIASYIIANDFDIKAAIQFAIKCSYDVITKEKTAITNIKL